MENDLLLSSALIQDNYDYDSEDDDFAHGAKSKWVESR